MRTLRLCPVELPGQCLPSGGIFTSDRKFVGAPDYCWFTERVKTNLPGWRRISTLAIFILAGSLQAQSADLAFLFEAEVKVPMRDGVSLAANVYRPKGKGVTRSC